MTEWIPLLQSLVWPVFLAIFLFVIRRQVTTTLTIISKRIEGGDPFQAGPGGFSLGQSERKLTRLEEVGEKERAAPGSRSLAVEESPAGGDLPGHYEKVTYLVHSVSAPHIDTDGVERRDITAIVDADSEDILNQIERVVYHLHPTFANPDREVKDRQRRFALTTRAWGEFNLSADVYFKGYKQPLTLFRYLNFQH